MCSPIDGRPTRASPTRDARRIGQHRALDDADHAAGQVVAAIPIRARHLGGLAADDRDARRSARLGHPAHERAHDRRVEPVGGDVVEERDRGRGEDADVVDAVVDEVATGTLGPAPVDREVELRADAVHARDEQRLAIPGRERERTPERSEPGVDEVGARALDELADALLRRFRRVEVDAGARVRRRRGHAAHAGPTASSCGKTIGVARPTGRSRTSLSKLSWTSTG